MLLFHHFAHNFLKVFAFAIGAAIAGVAGSLYAHLLTFMEHIGYRIPKNNVMVQPNIVDFSEVSVTDLRPPRNHDDIIKSDELTFFGRLESRKGLEIFCSALDSLVDRKAISPASLPPLRPM